MKSWGDLSWREKCKIRKGDTNSFNYLAGYTFQVKTEVKKGIENKEGDKND